MTTAKELAKEWFQKMYGIPNPETYHSLGLKDGSMAFAEYLDSTYILTKREAKCYKENGMMICYCGKCEPDNYPLPKDFPKPKEEAKCGHPFLSAVGDRLSCTRCTIRTEERAKEEPKLSVTPSSRIDWCCECKAEHGYDCPKDEPKKIEKITEAEELWILSKINELIDAVNKLNSK